jgi:putative flippase GtrA
VKDARSDAVRVDLKGHARRFHLGARRPSNWLELVRFCVVGGSGYVINVGLFWLAYRDLPYIWNRVWTFKIEHGVPHVQYARFLAVSLAALAIDLAALAFLVEVVGVHKPIAAATAIVVATPISFLGNKLWSFR